MRKTQKGITLIALIITIVVLLILAVVAIRAVQGNGIIAKAKSATSDYEQAQDEENAILGNYTDFMEGSLTGESESIKMADAQGKVLSTTDNTDVKDEYGNIVRVPAGFMITTDANHVTEGIVIEDCTSAATKGSQFVWIPVGTVYTNVEQTESKTITLGRYVFTGGSTDYDGDGTNETKGEIVTSLSKTNPSDELKTSSTSTNYYTEGLKDETTTNAHAKDIESFISSAKSIAEGGNGGYYLGRYEAGTETARSSEDDELTQLIVKSNVNVYNYVTQSQASSLSQGMYEGNAETNVISDLINSYAWDTAIVFIQTFSTNSDASTYSRLNKSTTRTVTGGNGDEYCKINDMSGNVYEWSTETTSYAGGPCVFRGGCYYTNSGKVDAFTSFRGSISTSYSFSDLSFRLLLYW